MFHKILLPLDLTEKHQPAIRTAIDLAKSHGGEILLFHVIESIAGVPLTESFYEKLTHVAQSFLSRLQREVTESGVRCQCKVVIGHRVQDSSAYAAESAADLIIVTAPKFDAQSPAPSLGSLSYRISILAPCPVLIVK